jgi:hypothetical protein
MKGFIQILVVVAILGAGYFYWKNHNQASQSADQSAQQSTPAPVVASTPAPVASQPAASAPVANVPVAAPTPGAPALPPGVYYLTQRMSVTTDSSILAFDAGTEVKEVKQGDDGQIQVTDGTNTFSVLPSQITNDPNVAASILQANAQARAAADAAERARASQIAAYNRQQNASAGASMDAFKRTETIKYLREQIVQFQRQDGAIQSQITADIGAITGSHAAVHSALPTWGDVGALRQQLGQVQQQEMQAQSQITQLQNSH